MAQDGPPPTIGDVEIRATIIEKDEDRQLAFGYANVFRRTDESEVVDSHDDTIDSEEAIAAIEDAVYRYVLESRSGDEQHVNYGVARLVESVVYNDEKRLAKAAHATRSILTGEETDAEVEALLAERVAAAKILLPDGWWVGFKVDDADAWQKVKDGTYTMFSIVGHGRRVDR